MFLGVRVSVGLVVAALAVGRSSPDAAASALHTALSPTRPASILPRIGRSASDDARLGPSARSVSNAATGTANDLLFVSRPSTKSATISSSHRCREGFEDFVAFVFGFGHADEASHAASQ